MSVTQTVEIPAGRKLTAESKDSGDVPREIPAGPAILTFTPAATDKTGWRSLVGIHKGMDTMEAYFKRHWAENDREREQEREQYPEYFRETQP